MPSPVAIFSDPVSLICLAIYAALILWEFLRPARSLPVVSWWPLKGLAVFVCYFLLSSYLPLWWDAWLAQWRLLTIDNWSVPVQAVAGLLTYEFLVYWWHRSMHKVNWLWRSFHQFHHSAERLDTFGAFWFSPLDMVGFTLVASLALSLGLGLDPQAAVLVLYSTFFLAVFQHANIRTPQWLGYFLQRPESHSRHHGKGVHRDNYSDLPVFDLLFGTFHNPPRHYDTGLYYGASSELVDMLLWRDLLQDATRSPAPGLLASRMRPGRPLLACWPTKPDAFIRFVPVRGAPPSLCGLMDFSPDRSV